MGLQKSLPRLELTSSPLCRPFSAVGSNTGNAGERRTVPSSNDRGGRG